MKRVLIAYHSQQYGNTHKMAQLVAEGCREVPGVEVDMVNLNEERACMDVVEAADGYALGSPDYFTYMAGGLKQFFDDLYIAAGAGREVKGKPYVGFLTHGGGGGAIESVERLAKSMSLEQVAESVSSVRAPEGPLAQTSIDLGRALAERVIGGD